MNETERNTYLKERIAQFTPAEREEFDSTGAEIKAIFARIGFDPKTEEFKDRKARA